MNNEENPCKGLIHPGEEYTYKDLCEAVNDRQRGGDSKKAQLKKWARHFSWEYPINPKTGKPSKKFLIKEVFEEVLPEETRRLEYDISDILLMLIDGYSFTYYEDKEDYYSMGITKTKINELVGLCNDKYVEVMRKPIADMPITTHRDFFQTTGSSFDTIIKSNFKSLEKKNVLVYTEGQLWYEEYYDEKGKMKRTYKLASDKEFVVIQKARYNTIKRWNEENGTDLISYGQVSFKLNVYEQMAFDKMVIDEIRKEDGMAGYSGSYACHKITFSKSIIKKELDKRQLTSEEQQILMNTLKKDVNEQMMTKVLKDSRMRIDKAREAERDKKKVMKREHGFGVSAIPMSASMNYRLEDKEYIKHCDEIASVVIPLKEEQ